jgi:FAD:protein FMN transferase
LLRIDHSVDAMGSAFALVLWGSQVADLESVACAADAEIRRIEKLLSAFDPESEVSHVNRRAAAEYVQVSGELFEILYFCLRYHHLSEGAFDISVGALVKTWGFSRGHGRLPAPGQIAEALERTGSRHVILDHASKSVRFARQGLSLDFGGIGKGIAVDRAAAMLRAGGCRSALIAASGSSILALGTPPEDPRGWKIRTGYPGEREGGPAWAYLKDGAISTSGGAEKCFWEKGKLYSHILDPRSGDAMEPSSSVSVFAPTGVESEAWTKPCLIRGQRWAEARLPAGVRALFSSGA